MGANYKNPFTWVEIYVEDMDRAQKFYETVFDFKMLALPSPTGMREIQMVSFPWANGESNISGALVKMDQIKPGLGGTLVYFGCEDCSVEENRVEQAGGKILQSKKSIGEYGFCSIFLDTEGNSIGLHSMS